MAKQYNILKEAWSAGLQAAIEFIIGKYWPWLFPVLTGASQFVYAIPWPYFFIGLGLAIGVSIWTINLLKERRIDDKFLFAPDLITFGPMKRMDKIDYGYQFLFKLSNINKCIIFYDVKDAIIECGSEANKAINTEKDIAAMATGTHDIYLPTVMVGQTFEREAKFKVTIEIGRSMNAMEYQITLGGTVKFLVAPRDITKVTTMQPLEFSWRATERTIESI